MLIHYKLGLTLMLIFVSYATQAAVYKCEENGNITFSDKPCVGESQNITEQHVQSIPKKQTGTGNSASQSEKIKKMADDMQSSRIQRELTRDINSLEKQIDEKKIARDKELQTLSKTRDSLGYGDDYDDELRLMDLKKTITDNIAAITNRYSAEINALNEKITGLRERLIKSEP